MTAPARHRRAYIDWLRGVAVVVMIYAHTVDAWTIPADKTTELYGVIVVRVAGFASPLFLFLAGLAVPLAARARMRKGASVQEAGAAVRRRGLEIFGLAFLFRLQSFVLSPGSSLGGLLKVDILNIMGPGIALAASIWAATTGLRPRLALLAAVACGFSLLTPFIRASEALAALPDWLEAYLRPPPGRSWFTLFPWVGLLVAGSVVGELIARAENAQAERVVLRRLAIGGGLLFVGSLAGSYLPSLYADTSFWTTSPSYFFLRVGLLTCLLPLSWLRCRRLRADRFSPMLQFGHTSLFIYWIHVEMAYGLLSWPLHRALPLAWSLVAFAVFTALMLWASIAKDRWATARRARRAATTASA